MKMNRVLRTNASWITIVFLFYLVSLSLLLPIQCVDGDDYSETGNPTVLPIVANLVYARLMNVTKVITKDNVANLGFCINDVDKDWDGAFNFTGKLDFLTACIKQVKAEIRFYFKSFFNEGGSSSSYVKPNKTCNLTSWVSGCDPGWGCSSEKSVALTYSKDIPIRSQDCQPCCEGFFCPQGLTCMIPCPLGSYCPLAKLNSTTGICDPYSYQIPPGETNHTCGSADIWTGVVNSSDIEKVGKQQLREANIQVVDDYMILLVAGAILGTLTKVNDETLGSLGYTYTVIAVSLLWKIAALRSFSQDKLEYWRETACGISSLAHFFSKDTIDLFNTVIKPVVYLSMFCFLSNPRSSFASNYMVLFCLLYCVTGMAYALAIYLEPGPA